MSHTIDGTKSTWLECWLNKSTFCVKQESVEVCAYHELHLRLVKEGPRGALWAPEEHAGLFTLHLKPHVAAEIKKSN